MDPITMLNAKTVTLGPWVIECKWERKDSPTETAYFELDGTTIETIVGLANTQITTTCRNRTYAPDNATDKIKQTAANRKRMLAGTSRAKPMKLSEFIDDKFGYVMPSNEEIVKMMTPEQRAAMIALLQESLTPDAPVENAA